MNKQIIQKFISKYSVNGNIESVSWTPFNSNQFKVSAAKDSGGLVVMIKTDTLKDLPQETYNIFDTKQLQSLLSVLEDNIQITPKYSNETELSGLTLSDSTISVFFALADSRAIPDAPKIKQLPIFEINTILTEDFINRFIKSVRALDEDLAMIDNKNIIIGYSANTNKSSISFPMNWTGTIEDNRKLYFPTKYLVDVFNTNKDCSNISMEVSSRGLIHINCGNTEEYTIDYYLTEVKI